MDTFLILLVLVVALIAFMAIRRNRDRPTRRDRFQIETPGQDDEPEQPRVQFGRSKGRFR